MIWDTIEYSDPDPAFNKKFYSLVFNQNIFIEKKWPPV